LFTLQVLEEGAWIKGNAMKVMIMGQVLIRKGSGMKDYSSKKKDNGMPISRTRILLVMFRIIQYVDQLETFGFSLKNSHFTI